MMLENVLQWHCNVKMAKEKNNQQNAYALNVSDSSASMGS